MLTNRIVVLVILLSTPVIQAGDPGPMFEIRFCDGGFLPVRIRESKLDLTTKYGTLNIPLTNIRRVEVATRISTETATRVADAVERLGHADFGTRRRAEVELRDYQVRAYPLLLKAAKLPDPETARRAEALVQALRRQVPADDLRIKEFDLIHTEEGQLTGRLSVETLRIGTSQFGELILRLADVREIRQSSSTPNVATATLPAPLNLLEYQGQFGSEKVFVVSGAQPPQAQAMPPQAPIAPLQVAPGAIAQTAAAVWGTDIYTIDSHLATAAVHAGAVRPGETVNVRIRILLSPPIFTGSNRNGILSNGYNFYPPGAFEFVRP